MDWLTIGATVLGSGLVSTAITLGVDWFRQGRKDMGALRYLSMQLAARFESYSIDCMEAHSENENEKSSGGSAGDELTELLQVPELPELDGYQLLKPSLLDRIYHLKQMRMMGQRAVISIANYGHETDADIEISEQNLAMAKESRDIAKELRTEAKLPARPLVYKKYDVDGYLDGEIERVKERRARYDRKQERASEQLITAIDVMEKQQAKER